MTNLKLTEHFNLIEFERSSTAQANGIDNTCPSQYTPSLLQLCKEILEPLRAFANQPIIISSGYRSNALNIKVVGAYASQHTIGEDADIQIPKTPYTEWSDGKAQTDKDILNRWFDWIISNTDFDQAIIETSNGKDFWIHVSCRKNKSQNRRQVLRLTKK